MKTTTTTLVTGLVTAMVAFCTGCGTLASESASPPQWQTHKLADGVEIRVSSAAGPEAERIVEEMQKEMRSRYINAAQ